jgi:trehalose 6-phosphate phosphatase
MKVLTSSLDMHGFLARIGSVRERVLMLDYDGTLAPFHVQPERALPYPGVAEALGELMDDGGTRVVIISGRSAAELVPLLTLERHPEIWGCHGWERLLPNGELRVQWLSAPEAAVLEEAARAVRDSEREGARVERKTASVALHWRGLPAMNIETIREQAQSVWSVFAEPEGMELLAFDGGIELRARGCNKQHAAKAVLSETGADSAIAYLGDDVTDEDAFAVMKLRGIGVLVRPEYRETGADVWLRPPGELLAFLGHWRVKRGNT